MKLLFGIFAVAALRIMPSVRSIMGAWTSLRYNRYTIDVLRDARLYDTPAGIDTTQERMPFEREIRIEGLSFHLRRRTRPRHTARSVAHDPQGRAHRHTGCVGRGKDDAVQHPAGLLPPHGGPHHHRRPTARRNESPQMAEHDRIRFAECLHCRQLLHAERGAGLRPRPDRPPACGAGIGNGQTQRVHRHAAAGNGDPDRRMRLPALGRATPAARHRPRTLQAGRYPLFFDEATSALDNRTEERINRAIKELSKANRELTIIVVAHRESSLDYCDRIITLGEKQHRYGLSRSTRPDPQRTPRPRARRRAERIQALRNDLRRGNRAAYKAVAGRTADARRLRRLPRTRPIRFRRGGRRLPLRALRRRPALLHDRIRATTGALRQGRRRPARAEQRRSRRPPRPLAAAIRAVDELRHRPQPAQHRHPLVGDRPLGPRRSLPG